MRRFWSLAVPGLAVLLVVVVALLQPRFLSFQNLGNVAGQAAPLVIFTLAQMQPILTRGLDLSQGGVVVATSVVFALLSQAVGVPAAAVISLGVGLAAGLVNGGVVAGLSVSPLVATLGIGSVLQGLALVIANGQPIFNVPPGFSQLFYTRIAGLPAPIWVALLVAAAQAVVLSRTVLGRYVYAVGSNDRAAFLSGVPVRTAVVFAYAASGVLTALGAVLLSSRIASGHPTAGADTALQAVAGAVIGGVSLFGGRGRTIGAVCGAVFLALLSNALDVVGVSSFLQLVAVGLAIIGAVVVDRLRLNAAASAAAAPLSRPVLAGFGAASALVLAVLVCRSNAQQAQAPVAVKPGVGVTYVQPDAPLAPVTARRRYRIGVSYPFLAAPFWVNEAYGITDEARRMGVDVVWLSADGYDNIDKQNGQIEALAARGVDALLVAATSTSGTVPAVDRASAAGIPVFAHVTSTASPRLIGEVLNDDVGIGRAQAEFMGKALGGHGRVAMLNGPAAGEWSIHRVRGFKEVMAARYPGITIVAEKFGVPDRSASQKIMEDLLTAQPDLDGVFTVADSIAMGAADAARNAGRLDRIVITTTSFSKEALPYLKSGAIDVNVDENPVLMGRLAIANVVRGLNGEQTPRTIYVPSPPMTAESLAKVKPDHWAPDSFVLK